MYTPFINSWFSLKHDINNFEQEEYRQLVRVYAQCNHCNDLHNHREDDRCFGHSPAWDCHMKVLLDHVPMWIEDVPAWDCRRTGLPYHVPMWIEGVPAWGCHMKGLSDHVPMWIEDDPAWGCRRTVLSDHVPI